MGYVFTLYRIDFAQTQKPCRMGILFTHKNGDFGAISVTERSCPRVISKLESHILDKCSHYTRQILRRHKNHTGWGFCSQIRTVISVPLTEQTAPRRSLKWTMNKLLYGFFMVLVYRGRSIFFLKYLVEPMDVVCRDSEKYFVLMLCRFSAELAKRLLKGNVNSIYC